MLKILKAEGKENLTKEILCICNSREDADKKEREYIEKYDAVNNPNFYNLQEGGTGGDGWRACQRWWDTHPEEKAKAQREGGERLQRWRFDHPKEFQEQVVAPMLKASHEWMKKHPEEVAATMKKVNEAKEKWQQEHKEEHQRQIDAWRKAGSDANSKRIRCVTTGEEFESFSAAARAYQKFGVNQSNLSKIFKGERKTCGKKDGEKLRWELIQ